MRIGITGAEGFVGWHLRCYLSTLSDITECRLATRATFSDQSLLCEFVTGLDIIVHLVGVNRATDAELVDGNVKPAEQLIDALKFSNTRPCIVFTSSTQTESGTHPYACGKRGASNVLAAWAEEVSAKFVNLIVPHVFGEYGRPYYNSAVATFCHQIVHGEIPTVNGNGQLELIHVQDLVERIVDAANSPSSAEIRIRGFPISVPEVVTKLTELHHIYTVLGQWPELSDRFTRDLFNALRGAIPPKDRQVARTLHTDDRGWLVETVKARSGGQCFVSSTHPGITRGNHFHRRKVERFLVLSGVASIKLRRLFSDEILDYEVSGDRPCYIDIPTLHTHCITNIGQSELITLFWTNEFYDPVKSDTYFHKV